MDQEKVQARSSRKKRLCISLPTPLIGFIDDEAEKICMTRSEYLEFLCMKDFELKVMRKMLGLMNS